MRAFLLRVLTVVGIALSWAVPAGAATFGNTNIEVTTSSIENSMRGYCSRPSSNGTADSVYAYLDFTNDVGYDFIVKCALYKDTACFLSASGSKVWWDSTNQRTLNSSSADGWYGFDLLGNKLVSNSVDTIYTILVWSSGATDADFVFWRQGTSTGDTINTKSSTPGAWPATLTAYGTTASRRGSIYVKYDVTATSSPRRRRILEQTGWLVPANECGCPSQEIFERETRKVFAEVE